MRQHTSVRAPAGLRHASGTHSRRAHKASLECEGGTALVPLHAVLPRMLSHHMLPELGFGAKHDKLELAALLKCTQVVFLLKMLLQVSIVAEVDVVVWALAAAKVAVVVMLLHVLEHGCLIVEVLFAETAWPR